MSKGQNEYYCKFLKKLAKKAELKQEIKIKTEAKVKEIVAHTVNTPNSNSDYPLHLAIKNNDKELFKELLQEGRTLALKVQIKIMPYTTLLYLKENIKSNI